MCGALELQIDNRTYACIHVVAISCCHYGRFGPSQIEWDKPTKRKMSNECVVVVLLLFLLAPTTHCHRIALSHYQFYFVFFSFFFCNHSVLIARCDFFARAISLVCAIHHFSEKITKLHLEMIYSTDSVALCTACVVQVYWYAVATCEWNVFLLGLAVWEKRCQAVGIAVRDIIIWNWNKQPLTGSRCERERARNGSSAAKNILKFMMENIAMVGSWLSFRMPF